MSGIKEYLFNILNKYTTSADLSGFPYASWPIEGLELYCHDNIISISRFYVVETMCSNSWILLSSHLPKQKVVFLKGRWNSTSSRSLSQIERSVEFQMWLDQRERITCFRFNALSENKATQRQFLSLSCNWMLVHPTLCTNLCLSPLNFEIWWTL